MPQSIYECKCLILNKESEDPSLVVIGGRNGNRGSNQKNHWEIPMSNILDKNTFVHFNMDLQKVKLKKNFFLNVYISFM